MLRILFITGSIPKIKCGVGDYSSILIQQLSKTVMVDVMTSNSKNIEIDRYNKNVEILQLSECKWSIYNVFHFIKKFFRKNYNVIHMQYPTVGYKKNIGILLIPLFGRIKKVPVVLTLHEFSKLHLLKKGLFALILASLSNKVILTTEEERKALSNKGALINIKKKCTIIPIGSNIPSQSCGKCSFPDSLNNSDTLCFFGFLMPSKNIRSIIDAICEMRKTSVNIALKIIGDEHPDFPGELKRLKEYVKQSGLETYVSFHIGKSPNEVAKLIASSLACILLYNDGVSFRRGSLLAAVEQDCVVITNKGKNTPLCLQDKKNILFAENKAEIVTNIQYLLDHVEKKKQISELARKTILNNRSWIDIERSHLTVYREMCKKHL